MSGTPGINVKHGHAAGGKVSPTYATWAGMVARCTNTNMPRFDDYGGRGITLCARWLYFENFLEDMGERPDGMTLERENNDKGYEPGNCRWATPQEQARNQRSNRQITALGKTQLLCEWAEETGLDSGTIAARIDYYGWPPDQAVSRSLVPPSESNARLVTFNGETCSISEWARRLGVTTRAMVKRLDKWPLDKALTTPKKIMN